MYSEKNEQLRARPNLPPGNDIKSKICFLLRAHIDLMVASVLDCFIPWASRCKGKVLEVGCGAKPYRHLIPSDCVYQGLDHEMAQKAFNYKEPDVLYYDGEKFPLMEGSFDFIFHTEVMEHIFDTVKFLRECRRVLKNGGSMFFSVPFQARYHYIPNDYWRFTPSALQLLLEKNGFTDIIIVPRGTDITVASHKVFCVIFRLLQCGLVAKIIGIIFLPWAAMALLIGHLSLRLKVGSTDDCLGYNVTAKAA